MRIKSLALILSCVLLFGCMCGCDTVTNDPTSATDGDTTAALYEDTTTPSCETTITTQPRETVTTKKVTTTTKKATTATKKITTATKPKATEALVWIPTSGSKYHRTSSCSNMTKPSQVTKSKAESLGYTPCKRCYG